MMFYMDNDTSSKNYSSVNSVASMRDVSWGKRQREIRMGYITIYILKYQSYRGFLGNWKGV